MTVSVSGSTMTISSLADAVTAGLFTQMNAQRLYLDFNSSQASPFWSAFLGAAGAVTTLYIASDGAPTSVTEIQSGPAWPTGLAKIEINCSMLAAADTSFTAFFEVEESEMTVVFDGRTYDGVVPLSLVYARKGAPEVGYSLIPTTVADGTGLNISSLLFNAQFGAARFNLQPTCFLAGTRIRTPSGERNVEDFVAGDVVLTHDGRTSSVVLVQRKTWHVEDDPRHLAPVCLSAGALGATASLFLTPNHGVLVAREAHAQLVPAALVEGAVKSGQTRGQVTYYHLQLCSDFDMLVANGVVCESLRGIARTL